MSLADRYPVVWCFLLVGGPVAAVSRISHAQEIPAVEAVQGNAEAQVVDAAYAIGDPWWDDVKPDAAREPRPTRPVQPPNRQAQRAMAIVRRELSLVRATCPSLSREAREAILTAGLQAVGKAEAAKPAAAPAQKIIAPGAVVRIQAGGSVRHPDVAPVVEAAVAEAVSKRALPEEAEAFTREVAARAARRREAAVAILVEAVDQTALLDESQRQALARALDKHWQPLWERLAFQVGQSRVTGRQLPPGVAAVVADVRGQDAFNTWQERLRRLPGS
jgi:hypothetical protein